MPCLIVTSIFSIVLQNTLVSSLTKTKLRSERTIASFNILPYAVCAVTFGILMMCASVSVYTLGLGLLFGIVTALSNAYKMRALSIGPMHLTLLFTTSSMIIPALSGIFFGETFSAAKLFAVVLLVFFLYLSFGKSRKVAVSGKWFLFSLLAFVFQGTIGVLQKIHQSSAHKAESSAFLFVAFLCALVFCLIRVKGKVATAPLDKKTVTLGIVCGGCTFAMNYINLKLSGLLPSQLFFPLINGSSIVLCALISLFVFKEKLTVRQTVGLVGGIAALIAVCIVP